MKRLVVIALAFGLLCGAESVRGDDTLQGTWKLIAGEADGKALSGPQLQDGTLVIQGDHYRVTLNGLTITGEQKLDPTASLKTIDITNSSGPDKNQTCLGIYELQGDEFRVTFAPPGKPRPTAAATKPNTGCWTHVWKRALE